MLRPLTDCNLHTARRLGPPPETVVCGVSNESSPRINSPRSFNAPDPRFNNLLILSPAGVELFLARTGSTSDDLPLSTHKEPPS